jgi:hypothetical protein
MLRHDNSLKFKLMGATAATALLLSGCNDKDGDTKRSSNAPAKIEAAAKDVMGDKSPIDKPFKLKDATPLDVQGFATLMDDAESEDDIFRFASSSFDESIGATVLTDVEAGDAEGVTKIGRVELYGVNSEYLEQLKAEELSDTKQEVFRKVRLFDMSVEAPEGDGTFTIGAMEIDGLKFGGFTEEGLEAMEDGAQFQTVMDSVEVGGVYFKDITIAGFEEEGTSIDLSVADMRFGGFNGGTFGPMLFKNLDFTQKQSAEAKAAVAEAAGDEFKAMIDGPLGNLIMPSDARYAIDYMSFDGFSFAGLLPYLAQDELPPLDAKGLLSVGKIEAKNTDTYINGKKAASTEYSAMDPIEFAWLVPTRIKSYSTNNVVDFTAYVPEGQDQLMAVFKDNGLETVSGDGEMLWLYDDKEGNASLSYDAKLNGFANINLDFNASNAELATLHAAGIAEDEAAFTNIAINDFTLRIEDDKLLDVIFGVAALQMGQDAEQLRASAPLFISMGSAQFAQMNPAIPGYLEAVSGWITNGGTLEVKMSPENPVSFGSIAAAASVTPQTLPDVLSLTVTHTE